MPLGELHIWEVSTWEILIWEVSLGKIPNTLSYLWVCAKVKIVVTIEKCSVQNGKRTLFLIPMSLRPNEIKPLIFLMFLSVEFVVY